MQHFHNVVRHVWLLRRRRGAQNPEVHASADLGRRHHNLIIRNQHRAGLAGEVGELTAQNYNYYLLNLTRDAGHVPGWTLADI